MNRLKKRFLLFLFSMLLSVPMLAQTTDAEERRLSDIVDIYFEGNNDYEFYVAIGNYRKHVDKQNDKMKYYFSWSKEIEYDINHSHYNEALEKTEQFRLMLLDSQEEKYYFLVDYLMGIFYGSRDNNSLCQEYLTKAYEAIQNDEKLLHERVNVLHMLININIFGDQLKAYNYADKALAMTTDSTDLCTTYALKSMAALAHSDQAMFEKCYAQIQKLRKGKGDDYQYNRYVRIGRHTFNQDYELAAKVCDSLTFEVGRLYFLSAVYHMSGDKNAEIRTLRNLIEAIGHRNDELSSLTISNIQNEFNQDREQLRAHKIQLLLTGIIVFLITIGFIAVGYLYHKKHAKKK